MRLKTLSLFLALSMMALPLSGCVQASKAKASAESAPAVSESASESVESTGESEAASEPVAEDSASSSWSLLQNLPEFTEETKDDSGVILPNGVPAGVNPFEYETDELSAKLYTDSGVSIFGEVDQILSLPIKGILTLEHGEEPDTASIASVGSTYQGGYERAVDELALDVSAGGKALNYQAVGMYYPVAGYNVYTHVDQGDNMTIGEALSRNLYYVSVPLADFEGFPEEGSAEEQTRYVLDMLGNPNGLFWENDSKVMWETEKQYQTYESFRDAPVTEEQGGKDYSLVWHYDGYSIAVACKEHISYQTKEAITQLTTLTVLPTPDTLDYYTEHDDKLISGYAGFGECPVQLWGTPAAE